MKQILALLLFIPITAATQTLSYHLKIDQFGYLPDALKVAVIADPQAGFNSAESYTPGNSLQIRRVSDNSVVFSAAPTAWKNGATDAISGDKAWWFDFSGVNTPGEYYVFNPGNNTRSESFRIAPDIYNELLKTALRTFYYQRCGTDKSTPYAEAKWSDPLSCHVAASQDKQCRLVSNPVLATERDLSGGWHDAGDFNKYVNFALNPVLDLAGSYLEQPEVFGDNYGIPESGNGVPDLLDELKWELDWLLRMQQSNGSVLCVVGGGNASPPSADGAVRRYGPATTSATYSAAAMFAIGSRAFRQSGNNPYADALQTAAADAWEWAKSNPGITYYNSGSLAAGEQETDAYGLFISRLCAAIYLYDITGDSEFKTWTENNVSQHHLMQWGWASMYETSSIDALLHYAALPGVAGSISNQIRTTYSNSLGTAADHLGGYNSQSDPYRAYLGDGNYVWGSNQIKSREGVLHYNMITHDLSPALHSKFRDAALEYLHYLHGVNPFGLCYLTNMAGLGAENSAREMYHVWFGDGTPWDNSQTSPKGPAPGYLTGGPNKYYNIDGCCPSNCGSAQNNALCATASLQPPLNQPAMKSYKDWNTSWPQNSWQVTEPAIYYQAAYIRLLSKFVQNTSVGVTEISDNPLVFRLLPNPATHSCLVQLEQYNSDACLIRLVNTSGQILQEKYGSEARFWLNLEGLPSGIYMVQVQAGTKSGVQRLIVR
ncbi:MAG: glycoside hydrolase family 9 protein [Lewinellaceae bacterium]|nr:glycoside hydrolase family 9 protein [Lewinellaceae bacterium]